MKLLVCLLSIYVGVLAGYITSFMSIDSWARGFIVGVSYCLVYFNLMRIVE